MPRPTNLAKLSVQDLQAELRRRQRSAGPLLRKRERLIKRLAAIDPQLGEPGEASNGRAGSRVPGGRRRAVNEMPLSEARRMQSPLAAASSAACAVVWQQDL